jgi:hypothetical protein
MSTPNMKLRFAARGTDTYVGCGPCATPGQPSKPAPRPSTPIATPGDQIPTKPEPTPDVPVIVEMEPRKPNIINVALPEPTQFEREPPSTPIQIVVIEEPTNGSKPSWGNGASSGEENEGTANITGSVTPTSTVPLATVAGQLTLTPQQAKSVETAVFGAPLSQIASSGYAMTRYRASGTSQAVREELITNTMRKNQIDRAAAERIVDQWMRDPANQPGTSTDGKASGSGTSISPETLNLIGLGISSTGQTIREQISQANETERERIRQNAAREIARIRGVYGDQTITGPAAAQMQQLQAIMAMTQQQNVARQDMLRTGMIVGGSILGVAVVGAVVWKIVEASRQPAAPSYPPPGFQPMYQQAGMAMAPRKNSSHGGIKTPPRIKRA